MPGPPPAIAAVRVAVRRALAGLELGGGSLVLIACSGGPDSTALAAATGFVAPRLGLRCAAVVVDHGLQPGSGQVAQRAAGQLRTLLTEGPVEVVRVQVGSGGTGPEAAARTARYAALQSVAEQHRAAALLLGHTRDDQAEQVLLGLARGSGARSLAGMPPRRLIPGSTAGSPGLLLVRPLLELGREVTRQACAQAGLVTWQDPHNEDPRFARVRARQALLRLEQDLGPGLSQALARSAGLLADDAVALEGWAEQAYRDLGGPPWPVAALGALPRAVRTRVWRLAALAAGSPGTDLRAEHLAGLDTLVTGWRGQGPLTLPGGLLAGREGDRVWLARPSAGPARPSS